MASQLDKEQIQLLLTTGVVGYDWPHETVVLCVLKKDNKVVFRKVYENVPKSDSIPRGKHAEIVMLEDPAFLANFTGEPKKLDIFLTMNYSPCTDICAIKLHEFCDEKKKYIETFTIRFSAVYKAFEKKQFIGLASLEKVGVILESMTEEVWLNNLKLSKKYLTNLIKERDKRTKDTLRDELLSLRLGPLKLADGEDGGKPGPSTERYSSWKKKEAIF